jgi:hypothetical protein
MLIWVVSSMLDVYTLIYNTLNPICNTYADHYPTTLEQEDGHKKYPYIEFSFPYAMPNNTFSDNNLLYVDIWDNKSGNIVGIETITDNAEKALNRLQLNNDKMQICIYKNNPCRFPVPDTDINIQRRELRFIVKTYLK